MISQLHLTPLAALHLRYLDVWIQFYCYKKCRPLKISLIIKYMQLFIIINKLYNIKQFRKVEGSQTALKDCLRSLEEGVAKYSCKKFRYLGTMITPNRVSMEREESHIRCEEIVTESQEHKVQGIHRELRRRRSAVK